MAGSRLGNLIGGILPQKKINIDADAMRGAGIDVLIQNERWNRLFSSVEKTPAIIKAEGQMKGLLDEKTRLHMENNMIAAERQVKLNRYTELTEKYAFDADEPLGKEAADCDARVKAIDERALQIEKRTDEIDNEVKAASLAMLESATSHLYKFMRKSRARVAELDAKITASREALKDMISEREDLSAAADETYQFLHGLLGADQIDSIDDQVKHG